MSAEIIWHKALELELRLGELQSHDHREEIAARWKIWREEKSSRRHHDF